MLPLINLLLTFILLLLLLLLFWRQKPGITEEQLETRHRAMLDNLHTGLHQQSERVTRAQNEGDERLQRGMLDSSERLREAVARELVDTRRVLQELQLSQTQSLSQAREASARQLQELSQQLGEKQDSLRSELITKTLHLLTEQNRVGQEQLQATLKQVTEQLVSSVGQLTLSVDQRLEGIGQKVNERLDDGFKKTNETFANVMARLATIDEAQKKIDGLASNVVSLQELLGDKRSRGAFGEVQLEALLHNLLPEQAFELQATLPNGTRVDCLLKLPPPTGNVAIDAKFPLENFRRLVDGQGGEAEQRAAQSAFKTDVRKHINDIADKYIIPGVTADGAVMFIPAEAIFAEIHAYHPDLVQLGQQKRVWIVSPTTLMAVLTTARAVLRDKETREQVHLIQEALRKLGEEFRRFDDRMKKLAVHIRQANDDVQLVQTTSDKINRQFTRIERVQLDGDGGSDTLNLEE